MRRMAGRKRKSSSSPPDTSWPPAPASKALKKDDMVCSSLLTAEHDGHQKQRSALPAPGSDGEEEEDECDVDYVRPSQCSPGGRDRELHLFITVDDGAGAGANRTREEDGGPGVPSWDKDAEDGMTDGWLPSNSDPSDGDDDAEEDEEEFGQLDIDLERKSREHNLTSGNIRSILHEVITNEHVVAMMKAAIKETQDLPLFEPKMTRSRLKQVVAQGESVLNLSPIRGALAKAPQFVDIPLEEEEDSSDEEYCPDEEEDYETAEESFLSDVDSLGSSPRVPRGTSRQHPPDALEHTHCATKRARCSRQLRVDHAADPTAPALPPPPPHPFCCSSTPASSPQHLLLHSGPTDTSFLERLCAVEEELSFSHDSPSFQGLNEEDTSGLVALRTRSKRPLRDVPLGLLEAELRAPDITPDMYEVVPTVLEEDRHWSHWLQGLMAFDNDEDGDDDDDPEYNFLEDVDEPDKEDYRTDRAVRITKKEVNQLLEELFDTLQDEVVVEEVEGEEEEEEEEDSQQLVPKYNVPQAMRFDAPLASMLTERRRMVREQYEAAQQKRALQATPGHGPSPSSSPPSPSSSSSKAPPLLTVVTRPPPTLVLDRAQKLRLQQQVQQHVQLLTQVHMLTQHVESLHYEAGVTKSYLEELGQYARRVLRRPAAPASGQQRALLEGSSFRASNLQGALDILQEEEAATRGQTAPPVAPNTWLPKKRSQAFPQLPADAAWLLATRGSVFLYPELLPTRCLDPDKQPESRARTMYAQGEDCLMALGLRHFEHTVLPVEQLCNYLVRKQRRETRRHIVDMCGPSGLPGNVLKVFHESGELPAMPVACSAALQGEQRPPVDRDFSLLPNWLKKSQAVIHGARLPSGGYPRVLPKNLTLRLTPALTKRCLVPPDPPPRPTAHIFPLAHNSALPPLASAGPVSYTQPYMQEVLLEAAGALPVQGFIPLAESACSLVQEPSPLGRAMFVPAQEPVSLAAVYPASAPHHSPTPGALLHPPESCQSSLTGAPPGGRRTQPNRQAKTTSKAAPARSASRMKKTPAPCDRPCDSTETRSSTPPSLSPPASPRTSGEDGAERADQTSGQARARGAGRGKARAPVRRGGRTRTILPDLPEEECHPHSFTATPPPLIATVSSPHCLHVKEQYYYEENKMAAQSGWIVRPVSGGTTLYQTGWTPSVRPVSGTTQNQTSWTPPPVRRVGGTTLYQNSWTQAVRPVSSTTLNQNNWTPPVSCAGVVPAAPNQSGDYVLVQIKDSSQVLWMRVEKNQNPGLPPPAPLPPQSASFQSTTSDGHTTRASFEEQLHRLVEGLREDEPCGEEEEERGGGEEEREGGLEREREGGETEKVTGEKEEGGGTGSSTSESLTSCTPPLHTLKEEEMNGRGEEEIDVRGEEEEIDVRGEEEEQEEPLGGVETMEEDGSESTLSSVSSSSYSDEDEEVRDSVSTSSSSDGDKVTETEGETEDGGEGGGPGEEEEEESESGGDRESQNGGGEERGDGGGGGESSGQGDGDVGGGAGGRRGDEEGDGDAEGQSGGERDEDKDGDGEEEEEEDFDDLTQDEDEEEAMSSASEESVLSVPELQETMKKLTWLASEGRLCGVDGDSEEELGETSPGSPNSPNSQEDISEEEEKEEEEELLLARAGQARGGKTTQDEEEEEEEVASGEGEGTPRRSGKGPGRGRGRARPGLLRRSRRQERHSKDTSKLLLLYDHEILDKDPLRDSKDTAFAQAYLTRVREALADTPGKMEEFLCLLYEHGQTGGEDGRDGGDVGDVVQLFRKLRGVLAEQPDLLRDFAAFLHPEQALECGLFEEQQAFERSRRFLRQLEISFGENPTHYQKIIKALQGGVSLSQASIEELKSQMATLLKGHTHLQGEFWVFFDELRPPPARPGQFEEAHWPEEGGGGSDGGGGEAVSGGGVGGAAGGGASGGGGGGFEEVTLPDLEEEEEGHKIQPMATRRRRRKIGSHGNYKECDWSDKDCSCPCHESKLRKHRRKGCPRCHGNKTSEGVSRAMKSLDPLYNLSVSPTANQPTEPGLEEGPEEKDPELEAELKEELDSDVNSPLPERGATSWDGVEEDASSFPPPPTGGTGGKEDEEEPEEMDEDERKLHDVGGVASPPGAGRRGGDSPPGAGEASPLGAGRRGETSPPGAGEASPLGAGRRGKDSPPGAGRRGETSPPGAGEASPPGAGRRGGDSPPGAGRRGGEGAEGGGSDDERLASSPRPSPPSSPRPSPPSSPRHSPPSSPRPSPPSSPRPSPPSSPRPSPPSSPRPSPPSSPRPSPPSGSDSPVPAKNMSLTPSGQKVILWTREADRVILTTCQQEGANQSTFQDISAQLANKTPDEVSQRFQDLMTLFHTAARQTNSEDEAPPTEPPSTNQEEEEAGRVK